MSVLCFIRYGLDIDNQARMAWHHRQSPWRERISPARLLPRSSVVVSQWFEREGDLTSEYMHVILAESGLWRA